MVGWAIPVDDQNVEGRIQKFIEDDSGREISSHSFVVGGIDGPVEEVGLRSTRIRNLEGHLVTIPNGALADEKIQNISKRTYLKRVVNIGVTYDTPPEKVERAVEIFKNLLDNHEGMTPDLPPRVVFNEFLDAALNILVIYWYSPEG